MRIYSNALKHVRIYENISKRIKACQDESEYIELYLNMLTHQYIAKLQHESFHTFCVRKMKNATGQAGENQEYSQARAQFKLIRHVIDQA